MQGLYCECLDGGHHCPINFRSVARNGSNLVGSLGPPVTGEIRGHNGGLGSHMYHPSLYSSSLRSSPFAPIRRMRPRGLTLVSSIAAPSSAEVGGFYGFSVSGSVNRNHQEGESIGRHVDRFYGWGREGISPLPWIPIEGESHWWSPFNPNQNPQSGNYTQRATAERSTPNCPENGYQHRPPPRLPPYMWEASLHNILEDKLCLGFVHSPYCTKLCFEQRRHWCFWGFLLHGPFTWCWAVPSVGFALEWYI